MLDQNWFSESADGYGMSLQIIRKLHEEQTPYQKLEVFETETFGNLMTLDGITMLTGRDNFIYHEMMSHPALFTHPNPKRVIIVGGGDCGTLREVLKHDEVETVIQVEIDERVTRVAEEFFPELCESNDDPRAEFLFEDAIKWMTQAEPRSVDVIILDTTDPEGQAERLFAEPFYSDCHQALTEGGIMIAQSESPFMDLEVLRKMRGEMKKAGFSDLQTLNFCQPTYPSGWWSATMARKAQKFGNFREQVVRRKKFETRYYNADIHMASQVLPEFLQLALT